MAKKPQTPKIVKPTIVDISKKGPQYYNEIMRQNNQVDSTFSAANALVGSTGIDLDASDFFTEKHSSGAKRRLGDSKYDSQIRHVSDFLDPNEFRANEQDTLDKIGNGLAGFAVNAASSFLSGTVGALYGIGSAVINWDASKLWNNEVQEALNNMQDLIGENYETREMQEKAWWQKLGTANFFASTLSNLGFMAGAMGAGALTGGVFGSLGVTARLGSLVGGLQKARAITGVISAISSGMGEASIEAMGAAEEMRSAYTEQAGELYLEELSKLNAARDSGQINSEEYEKLRDAAYMSYENGVRQGEESAVRGANMVFALNAALTTGADFIQYGRMFAGGYASSRIANNIRRKTQKDLIGEAVEGGTSKLATGAITDGFVRSANKLTDNGVFQFLKNPISEALEEQTQGAITKAGEILTMNDVKNSMAQELNANEFYSGIMGHKAIEETNNYFEAAAKGLYESYSGSWEEGFSGFLTAMLPFPLRHRDGRKGEWKWSVGGGAYDGYKEWKEQKSSEEALVEQLNKRVKDPDFLNYYQGLVRHKHFEYAMQDALNKDNEFDYTNSEFNQLVSDLMMFDNAGQLDAMLGFMEGVSGNLSRDKKLAMYREAEKAVREQKEKKRQEIKQRYDEGNRGRDEDTSMLTYSPEDGDAGFQEEIDAFEEENGYFDSEKDDHVLAVVDARLERNRAKLIEVVGRYKHIKNEIDGASGGGLDDEALQTAIWAQMVEEDSKRRIEQALEDHVLDQDLIERATANNDDMLLLLRNQRNHQQDIANSEANAIRQIHEQYTLADGTIDPMYTETLQGHERRLQEANDNLSQIDNEISQRNGRDNSATIGGAYYTDELKRTISYLETRASLLKSQMDKAKTQEEFDSLSEKRDKALSELQSARNELASSGASSYSNDQDGGSWYTGGSFMRRVKRRLNRFMGNNGAKASSIWSTQEYISGVQAKTLIPSYNETAARQALESDVDGLSAQDNSFRELMKKILATVTRKSRSVDYITKDLIEAEDASADMVEGLLEQGLLTHDDDGRIVVSEALKGTQEGDVIQRILDVQKLLFRHNTALSIRHNLISGKQDFSQDKMHAYMRYLEGNARRLVRKHQAEFAEARTMADFQAIMEGIEEGLTLPYMEATGNFMKNMHVFRLWNAVAAGLVSTGINENGIAFMKEFGSKVEEYSFLYNAIEEMRIIFGAETNDMYNQVLKGYDGDVDRLVNDLLHGMMDIAFQANNDANTIEDAVAFFKQATNSDALADELLRIAKELREDQRQKEAEAEKMRKQKEEEAKKKEAKNKNSSSDSGSNQSDAQDGSQGPSGQGTSGAGGAGDEMSKRGISADGKRIIDPKLYAAHVKQMLEDSGFGSLLKHELLKGLLDRGISENAERSKVDNDIKNLVDNFILDDLLDGKDNFFTDEMFDKLKKHGLTTGIPQDKFNEYREARKETERFSPEGDLTEQDTGIIGNATENNAKGVSVSEYHIDGARRGIKEDYADGELTDSSVAVRKWMKEKGIYKFIDSGGLYNTINLGKGGSPILFVSGTEAGLPDDVVLTAVDINDINGSHPQIPTDAIIEVDDAGTKRKLLVIGSLGSTTSATEEIKAAQGDTYAKIINDINERKNGATPSPISSHKSHIQRIDPGRLEVNKGKRYTLTLNDMAGDFVGFELRIGTENNYTSYKYEAGELSESSNDDNIMYSSAGNGVAMVYLKGADGLMYPKKLTMRRLTKEDAINPNGVLDYVIEQIKGITDKSKTKADKLAIKNSIGSVLFVPDPNNTSQNRVPVFFDGDKVRILRADGTMLVVGNTPDDVDAKKQEILSAIAEHHGARYNLTKDTLMSRRMFRALVEAGAIEIPIESTERFNASFMVVRPETLIQSGDNTEVASTLAKKLRNPRVEHDITIDGELVSNVTMAEDANGDKHIVAQDGASIEPNKKRADMLKVGFISKNPEAYGGLYSDVKVYKFDNENGRIAKVVTPSGIFFTTIGSGKVYSSVEALMQNESDFVAGILFNSTVSAAVYNGMDEMNNGGQKKRKKRMNRNNLLNPPTFVDAPLRLDRFIEALRINYPDGNSVDSQLLELLSHTEINVSEKLKGFNPTETTREGFKELVDRLFC